MADVKAETRMAAAQPYRLRTITRRAQPALMARAWCIGDMRYEEVKQETRASRALRFSARFRASRSCGARRQFRPRRQSGIEPKLHATMYVAERVEPQTR